MANFVSITKEGSIIIMMTDKKEKPFTFNCAERTLQSFTGRQVSTVNPLLRKCANNGNDGQRFLIDALVRYANYGDYGYMRRVERYITCLDLLEGYDCTYIPDECPKGYIKWARENNLHITKRTLKQFMQEQATKQMTKTVKEVYDIMSQHYNATDTYMTRFFELSPEHKEIFCKIFKTSMKSFQWSFRNNMEGFLYNIYNNSFPHNWYELADVNRDFVYNSEMLKELKNRVRNDKILEWENYFTAIEDLSNEDFVIIVPRTMEEFTNEGKQQNNCVGYYYHDSMAEHQNIIYFIRKKSNPQKSYLTNRYNVRWGNTAETRKVNNATNDDVLSRDLIKQVDKKIAEILKTL